MAGPLEIDLVVMWVDGARLADLDVWRHRLRGQLDPADDGPNRWRDNGELRYALRALAAHAPWLRRVHLVTSGEEPPWLDRAAPALRVWAHEDIFPDPSVLPTFNSAAITAALHRIPGLADRWLYVNDDVFLGRPTTPSDFFTAEGGTVVYVEPWPPPATLHAPSVVDRQLAFSRLLLGLEHPWMLAHAPRAFEQARVAELWERFRPHLERTLTHRFRQTDDALLGFLYCNALLAEGPPHRPVENHGDTRTVRVGWGRDLARILDELRHKSPLSFCLNDDVEDLTRDGWMWDAARAFLQERFPTPSPFER